MMPLLALGLTFGGITCWMIHQTVSSASDRSLVGSVTTLSRAIDTGKSVQQEILPLAVNLMRNRVAPAPIYSIYDGERLLAGTSELPPPKDYLSGPGLKMQLHEPANFPKNFRDRRPASGYLDAHDASGVIQPTYLRYSTVNGRPVRVAAEIRELTGLQRPVVIQVADYLDERRAYEQTYYLRVLGAGILIAMIAVLLFYGAVTWGLAPFASLTAQIADARRKPAGHLRVTLDENDPLEAHLLANAFNDLMSRTERATQSLRQFTANASHQLRTPLAIVQVHVDVLRRYGPDSPQGAAALSDITAAVDGLERLLSQLISLARMDEQPHGEPARDMFDLSSLAASLVGSRVTHPDAARMDIGFEGAEQPIMAMGDPMLASEMIGNLLDNAIRYNRPDGSVTVRVLVRNGSPVAEVEDDGPGIPRNEREKVWDRFYRAQGNDGPPGSGLGLSIVRALGERMGASVVLEEGAMGRGVLAIVEFQPAHAIENSATNDTFFAHAAKMTAC